MDESWSRRNRRGNNRIICCSGNQEFHQILAKEVFPRSSSANWCWTWRWPQYRLPKWCHIFGKQPQEEIWPFSINPSKQNKKREGRHLPVTEDSQKPLWTIHAWSDTLPQEMKMKHRKQLLKQAVKLDAMLRKAGQRSRSEPTWNYKTVSVELI